MKCPNCNSNVPPNKNYCPYCMQKIPLNAATTMPPSTEEIPKPSNGKIIALLKVAAIFLSIYLVITLCTSLYNNRGGYDISGYGFNGSHKVTYHGRLSKLYSKEYELLDEFIYNEKVSGKRVCHLVCNDYTLTHCDPGDLGTIDVLDDQVTLFQKGLHEYTVFSENDRRFFNDFVFSIKELDSGHEYYFYSLSDVEDWIADRV